MRDLILYNHFSGKGLFEKRLYILKRKLEEKGDIVDVYYTEGRKSMTRKAFSDGMIYDRFIVIGGDGTLNEAINGLMRLEKRPPVLYIPNGTVNDVGHALGLSRNVKKILKLLDTEPVLRDIGKINNRFFSYVAAAGKFTNVSYGTKHKKTKKVFGKFYYYSKFFKDLAKTFKYKFKLNGEEICDAYAFFILNNPRLASLWIHKKNGVKLNDGCVYMYIFKQHTHFSFLNLIWFLLFGDEGKRHMIEAYGSFFEIELDQKVTLNIDGEGSITDNKFSIEIIRQAIPFYVSKKAKKKYF